MESINTWYQNWAEACTYAQERVPDLSFTVPGEPYAALGSIAGAFSFIWWRNEKRLQSLLLAEGKKTTEEESATMHRTDLTAAIDQLQHAPNVLKENAA